ncbi:DBH-like monooxygenase protein 2, partial [Biomphalaria pfeifferi]
VCEPMGDPKCRGKNLFVTCPAESFDSCPVTKTFGIKQWELKFPAFSVPKNKTSTACMSYNMPRDQGYHIVAVQPIISNADVLHRMVLYGCHDDSKLLTQPSSCANTSTECKTLMTMWTPGQKGECFGDTVGFRMGATGFKRLRLQIYYTNPTEDPSHKDSSGLRLHYRPYRSSVQDAFTLVTGQSTLELPPGLPKIENTGTCKSDCTRMLFNKPVFVISGFNRMYSLGSSMSIQLYRNKVLIYNLTNDVLYNLDAPVTHYPKQHVQILPGDEIITRCVYNTTSAATSDPSGQVQGEMCYGYLNVYPQSALRIPDGTCVASSSLSYCERSQNIPVDGCDWKTFLSYGDLELIDMYCQLRSSCQLQGSCNANCHEVIQSISSHPCWKGGAQGFIQNFIKKTKLGSDFFRRLDYCHSNQPDSCKQNCSSDIQPGSSNNSQSSQSNASSPSHDFSSTLSIDDTDSISMKSNFTDGRVSKGSTDNISATQNNTNVNFNSQSIPSDNSIIPIISLFDVNTKNTTYSSSLIEANSTNANHSASLADASIVKILSSDSIGNINSQVENYFNETIKHFTGKMSGNQTASNDLDLLETKRQDTTFNITSTAHLGAVQLNATVSTSDKSVAKTWNSSNGLTSTYHNSDTGHISTTHINNKGQISSTSVLDLGHVSTSFIDSNGAICTVYIASNGNVSTSYKDGNGRVSTTHIDSKGQISTTHLDSDGHISISRIDSKGLVSTIRTDSKGRNSKRDDTSAEVGSYTYGDSIGHVEPKPSVRDNETASQSLELSFNPKDIFHNKAISVHKVACYLSFYMCLIQRIIVTLRLL